MLTHPHAHTPTRSHTHTYTLYTNMSSELFDYIEAVKPSLGDAKRAKVGLILIHYITLARVSHGRVRIDTVLTTSGESFVQKVLRNMAVIRGLGFALKVDMKAPYDDSPIPEGLRRLCVKYGIDSDECLRRNKAIEGGGRPERDVGPHHLRPGRSGYHGGAPRGHPSWTGRVVRWAPSSGIPASYQVAGTCHGARRAGGPRPGPPSAQALPLGAQVHPPVFSSGGASFPAPLRPLSANAATRHPLGVDSPSLVADTPVRFLQTSNLKASTIPWIPSYLDILDSPMDTLLEALVALVLDSGGLLGEVLAGTRSGLGLVIWSVIWLLDLWLLVLLWVSGILWFYSGSRLVLLGLYSGSLVPLLWGSSCPASGTRQDIHLDLVSGRHNFKQKPSLGFLRVESIQSPPNVRSFVRSVAVPALGAGQPLPNIEILALENDEAMQGTRKMAHTVNDRRSKAGQGRMAGEGTRGRGYAPICAPRREASRRLASTGLSSG
ncbi:hypothetical protein RHS04_08165 [Rhizoctonia solani]|uniref:Uncharacterized protein n=1 Tax=Rhizoctonia solani TaxID=456999 RepID=A0A8H7H257_9AGAM|nr:hypothetical protein RHS04_08165 [Rhizoctonia solani]